LKHYGTTSWPTLQGLLVGGGLSLLRKKQRLMEVKQTVGLEADSSNAALLDAIQGVEGLLLLLPSADFVSTKEKLIVDGSTAVLFMPSIDVSGSAVSVDGPKLLRVTPPFLFANLPEDSHFFAFEHGTPFVTHAEHLRAFARSQPPDATFRPWAFGYDMQRRGRASVSLTQQGSSFRPTCSDGSRRSRLTKLNPFCLVATNPLTDADAELPLEPAMCNNNSIWQTMCVGNDAISVQSLFQFS